MAIEKLWVAVQIKSKWRPSVKIIRENNDHQSLRVVILRYGYHFIRVGAKRVWDTIDHTIMYILLYHEDGVIEEIQGLGNYISAKTVRLLDEYTTTPDENAKLHTAGVDLPAYADKQKFWNFPPKSWRCNCCRAFNHESRMVCHLCCVDSRKWKDSFTQDLLTLFSRQKSVENFGQMTTVLRHLGRKVDYGF